MSQRRFGRILCAGAFASLFALTSARAAEDDYKGKQINLVVASAAGGGYDVIARMIGRHWPRHMRGDASVVVQNMPGAGGIRAANWLYNVAPKDGLTIGMINNTIVFDPIYGNKQAQFDSQKFNWLGTPSQETGLLIVWHRSGQQPSRSAISGTHHGSQRSRLDTGVFRTRPGKPVRLQGEDHTRIQIANR